MKPTGATKGTTNHSPLPWKAEGKGDMRDGGSSVKHACFNGRITAANGQRIISTSSLLGITGATPKEAEANAQLIVTAVNERERLRGIAKEALRFREERDGECGHDRPMPKLCTQCYIRAAINDTTPSTSAGGG